MRMVITGATGAIGTSLIKKAINENDEVLVITRKESKRNIIIPNNPLVKIVYSSLDQLKNLEIKETCDVFYHLAWDGTVGSERNNLHKQCDNIKYSIDAVNLAYKLGCKAFVGVGSQAEYGRVQEPLSENTSANPENGYGIAKLCAGKMTEIQAKSLGVRHVWVRVLSVYGPYDGSQSLVSSTINKATLGETILCTKGEQIWDYLYSDDAAEALYLLGKCENARGTYVLGSGKSKLLSEYIRDIRDTVNPSVEINFGAVPYNENQVMYLKADINKLKNDVGFEPKIDFCLGIKKIIKSRN